tara:strand:+ start:4370 stop:5134 length:765 start_codon:yes stop_codon:yes gene_type:complete
MRFDWKVYAKDRYVDSGTIQADTQKIAMGLVLAGQAEKDRDPDTSYRVTVGDSVTSSFGDEFLRSAEACSWTAEPEMDGGGVVNPSLADVGITLKDAREYTKGVVADLVETAGEALDKLTEIVEDEGWSLQMPVGAAVTGTICVSNLRDVGKPEDVVLKRVPVVGGEWVPVVEAPSEWISPPSGGSTAEQVRIASDELDARIASYPYGRMSVRAPNLSQSPKSEIERAWIGDEEIDVNDMTMEMFGRKPDDVVD